MKGLACHAEEFQLYSVSMTEPSKVYEQENETPASKRKLVKIRTVWKGKA